MTGPRQTDPRRPATAPVAVRVEGDPPPVVRALANDLAARLADPEFAEATRLARGIVNLRDASTPQSASIRLDEQGAFVTHGLTDGAALEAIVDLRGDREPRLEGEGEHPQLAQWVRELLGAEPEPWPDAAARFWAVLTAMPGAPEALRVVELPSEDERRYGAPGGRAYELHGSAGGLAAVLGGRTPLVDAAFAGEVFVRGSFAELSVLSGAGFRIRYGDDDAFAGAVDE